MVQSDLGATFGYLVATGRGDEAAAVMRKYGIGVVSDQVGERAVATGPAARRSPFATLFAGRYLRRSVSVVLYGLGWGVVNWGFITFLPTFLRGAGYSDTAESLLFTASLVAVPSTFVAAYLYGRWSSRKSMILYAVLTIAALGGFAALGNRAGWLTLTMLGVLLSTSAGMIAMLSPYSTEQYPTGLRATGSGVGTAAMLAAVPLALATAVLVATGAETSGRPLPRTRTRQSTTVRTRLSSPITAGGSLSYCGGRGRR